MSNVIYIAPKNRRRPQSQKQAKVDRAVQRFVARTHGNSKFTAKDIAEATKCNRYRVLKAVRRLEELKAVRRVGQEKIGDGPGRPFVIFSTSRCPKKIRIEDAETE